MHSSCLHRIHSSRGLNYSYALSPQCHRALPATVDPSILGLGLVLVLSNHIPHLLKGTMLTALHLTGSGQQLRNTPSNMFQVRQNESRAPLGTNRLQNGKLGEELRHEPTDLCH